MRRRLIKTRFFLIGHVTITKSGKNAREQAAARVGLASDGWNSGVSFESQLENAGHLPK